MNSKGREKATGAPEAPRTDPASPGASAYAPPAIAWEEPFEPLAGASSGCAPFPLAPGVCESQPSG